MVSTKTLHAPWLKLNAVSIVVPPDLDAKSIRNWSDRNLVSLADPKPGIRVPRLYSLANAIQLTILHYLSVSGNNLKFAQKIANLAVERTEKLISEKPDWESMRDYREDQPLFIFTVGPDGNIHGLFKTPKETVEVISGVNPITGFVGVEKRILPLDSIIAWVITRYMESKASGELEALNDSQR